MGEYAYAADDYKTAIAEYDTVITKFPESTYVPHAQYGKGWGLIKSKDRKTAEESFTTLLIKWPRHTLVPDGQFAARPCVGGSWANTSRGD